MEVTPTNVLLTILVVYTLSRVQKLYNGIRAAGSLPGLRVPFQPFGFPGGMFKTSWWNPGMSGVWQWRRSLYKQFGADTISVVPFISGGSAIFTSNLEVARQIKGGLGKTAFGKVDWAGPIGYWGPNMLTTEGDMWRKHRRVVGPAFSQKLYELVWSQSLDLYAQMLSIENPTNSPSFTLSRVQSVTFKFAFYIIGRCGFDFPFNWVKDSNQTRRAEDDEVTENEFAPAMRFFIDNIQWLNLSEGIRSLPVAKFKQLESSISTIRSFMETKIAEKESQVKGGNSASLGSDIFSMLVCANLAEDDARLKLDYFELISDVFLMLFAGHETTAHTLAASIACLATFPDQQQEVFEQIMDVIGNREPTIEDYPKLNKVQAAFYETLRMFPTAYVTIREAKEDTILYVPTSLDNDERKPVPVKKGTQMVVDMIGIHQNPRYFDDLEVFKVSRWEDVSNESEAIPAFGLGPRACIGRKFALTEAICFLTMLLRDYKIEPLLQKGESVDAWFENVQKCSTTITLGANDVGVRFVKR